MASSGLILFALATSALVPLSTSNNALAASGCVKSPTQNAHAATAISPSGLSENLSSNIGEIAPIAPESGQPDWDGADRAHDVITLPGDKAVIVGKFTAYTWKGTDYPRANFLVINTATGEPAAINTGINGEVFTVKLACDGKSVYVGGNFSRVRDAVTGTQAIRNNAARINLTDGSVMAWNPNADAAVYDIELVNKKLVVGGRFTNIGGQSRVGIASVNPSSGIATSWVNVKLSKPVSGSPLLAFNVVASPDGSRFVVTGNFLNVNGKVHRRIVVLQYANKQALVTKWSTLYTKDTCSSNKQYEELGVAFAPSGKYFYTVATGGDPGGITDCDSVARWPVRNKDLTNNNVSPVWINYTVNDSLSGVVATEKSVWVAGHNKWCSTVPGRPADPVDHPGICEIDVATGKATAWHGTTSRQRSMHVRMALTPQGLLYVGDANKINDTTGHNDLALWTWAN